MIKLIGLCIFILSNINQLHSAAHDKKLTIGYFIEQINADPESVLKFQVATSETMADLSTILNRVQSNIAEAITPLFIRQPKNENEFTKLLHLFIVTQALNKKLLRGYTPQSAFHELYEVDLFETCIDLHTTEQEPTPLQELADWLKTFKKKQNDNEISQSKQLLINELKTRFQRIKQQIEKNPDQVHKLIDEKRKEFIASLNEGQIALNTARKTFNLPKKPHPNFWNNYKAKFEETCIVQ